MFYVSFANDQLIKNALAELNFSKNLYVWKGEYRNSNKYIGEYQPFCLKHSRYNN